MITINAIPDVLTKSLLALFAVRRAQLPQALPELAAQEGAQRSAEEYEKNFLRLLSENEAMILKVCWAHRYNPEERKDLYQEIAGRLWTGFPNFRNEAKVSTWVYRIATNTALVNLRTVSVKGEFRESIPEQFHPVTTTSLPSDAEVHKFFKGLKPFDRAIVAFFLEGYSHQEIGTFMDLEENAVTQRLHRIRKNISKNLKKE